MKSTRVSVITPVYNAEAYVRQAVESALDQPETGEVILVEDASLDNSLQVCQELAEQYDKVRLFRHTDGKNHGAGASRNVGIRNARFEYIAFLDADDYFLPNRFTVAKQIFEKNPHIDGVYEAMGVHFETEAAERAWRQRGSKMLTTMTERVPPERLFESQAPVGNYGYCATGGWLVKRKVFEKTGLFDEHLRLHQDTVMYVKFSVVGSMVPGRLNEPVVMRRFHDKNRILAKRSPIKTYRNRLLMWETLWQWSKKNLGARRQKILLKRFVGFASTPYYESSRSNLMFYLQGNKQLYLLLKQYPLLSREPLYWREFIRMFRLLFANFALL